MHLILVSNRMATAKTLTITPGLAMLLALAFVALVFAAALLVASMGLRLPAAAPGHAVVAAAAAATAAPPAISSDPQDFVRGSLNAMAVKLGELQAQLLRLDSQGERLARLAGVAPESSGKHGRKNGGLGGEGGPLLLDLSASSEPELRDALEEMQGRLEQRRDRLTALESQLIEQQIKNSLLPTLLPIDGGQIGSGFGKRRDPIARMRARHEGVDFVADSGTRVSASAGGVVLAAEYHREYGNLIEIDHGQGLTSRYAHLARIDVQPGQIVRPGERIGASGSTGRSTGPHLHFEVRYKGVAQNPERFFRQAQAPSLIAEGGLLGNHNGPRLR